MHGAAMCNIYPLSVFSRVKIHCKYFVLTDTAQLVERWNNDCWFEPAACHYFSSNNVCLLAHVFTRGDPQLE